MTNSATDLHARATGSRGTPTLLLDSNLGLDTGAWPVHDTLERLRFTIESTDDLDRIGRVLDERGADVAFIPVADYHRLLVKGDRTYLGLAAGTSKYTGQSRLRSLLVVRTDDPAQSIGDLRGAKFGYINKACSSSFFPPAILLKDIGERRDAFLDMTPVKPGPTWQGLVDAVVSGEVRASMVLEDTWRATPSNAETTRIIGEYAGGLAGVIVVKRDLEEEVRKTLLAALVEWRPTWDDRVYGAFKPFLYADVHSFFHDLDGLIDIE